jgi:hypothetical protein
MQRIDAEIQVARPDDVPAICGNTDLCEHSRVVELFENPTLIDDRLEIDNRHATVTPSEFYFTIADGSCGTDDM